MGAFRKKEYFLGYEDFVDIFGEGGGGGHRKTGLFWVLGCVSMHFRSFLTVKVQHACVYVHITVRLFPCFYISVICSEGHMVDWPSS